MARGWESKSVAEAQTDRADVRHGTDPENTPDPKQLEQIREEETLLLSRTRVVREMSSARNPRYKALLAKGLADLDAKLTTVRRGLAT